MVLNAFRNEIILSHSKEGSSNLGMSDHVGQVSHRLYLQKKVSEITNRTGTCKRR